MKFFNKIKSAFIVLAAALLCLGAVSCQLEHREATASFSISKGVFADIKDWGNDSQNAYCYVVKSHGDYEHTWKGNFDFDYDNSKGHASIKGLPIGAEVSFTVNVYVVRKGVNYLLFDYTGESEAINIIDGENQITVTARDSLLSFVIDDLPQGKIFSESYSLKNAAGTEEFIISSDVQFESNKIVLPLKKGDLMSKTSNSAVLGAKYRFQATFIFIDDNKVQTPYAYSKEFVLESGNQTVVVPNTRTQPGDKPSEPTDKVATYIGHKVDESGEIVKDVTGAAVYTEIGPVTLEQAIAATIPSDIIKTIVLTADCTITEPIQIDNDTAINLNGHTITWNGEDTSSLFNTAKNATLILWNSHTDSKGSITSTDNAGTGNLATVRGPFYIQNIKIQNILSSADSLFNLEENTEKESPFVLDHVEISNCAVTSEEGSLIENKTRKLYCIQTTINDCYAKKCSGIASSLPVIFVGGHIDNTNYPTLNISQVQSKYGALILTSNNEENAPHSLLANTYLHSSTPAQETVLVDNSAHLDMKTTFMTNDINAYYTDCFSLFFNSETDQFSELESSDLSSRKTMYRPNLELNTSEMQETSWGAMCYRASSTPITDSSTYYGDDAIETVISYGNHNTYEDTVDFSKSKGRNKCDETYSYEQYQFNTALALGNYETNGYLHIEGRSTVYGLVYLSSYSYIQQTSSLKGLPEYPIKIAFDDPTYNNKDFNSNSLENPYPLFLKKSDVTVDNNFTINTTKTEDNTYFAVYAESYSFEFVEKTIDDTEYIIWYPKKQS